MTREEASFILANIDRRVCDDELSEALDMAIKALEQQPILDKISTEIEQVKSIMNEEIINNNRKDLINFVNGLNQSLMIIDKYKESEEV